MSDEIRHVEMLKEAYRKWGETLGASADDWLEICADTIVFGSLAESPKAVPYMGVHHTRESLRDYFGGLRRDWEMMEFVAEHFVAQDDRVVMLGRCAWRYKKTGKFVWTPKVDSWRFENGKAVEFFEYYDTAQVMAAVT
jgi:ketosteroid isomerase-like protein